MTSSYPFSRSSGVLLHPTSLPGRYGIGDIGPEAFRFVDFLAQAQQSWWQVLPLNPTGAGDSPYTSFSAFASNINLISPDRLGEIGLVDRAALNEHLAPPGDVDFGWVNRFKKAVIRAAWDRFRSGGGPSELRQRFEQFCADKADWLNDFALFTAIREGLGQRGLRDWPDDLRLREPSALAAIEQDQAAEIMMHRFGQFLFELQWQELRNYAAERKVKILGDAPIFIAGDSADVWAHPEGFLFDEAGNPTAVAGVPPDYFSPTGQLWGNPLYNWDRMAENGYSWWTARVGRILEQVDCVRLDHFRGFAAAWHVPPHDENAINGQWVPGPGAKLFQAIEQQFGKLPIVAEDLGLITEDVHQLRQEFGMPGMRVLQFALSDSENPYWPHNYEPLSVAYTGTHDNDTTNGWYAGLSEEEKQKLHTYLDKPVNDPAWELIRLAWSSVAVIAITPVQDLLSLGTEARMNVPGVAGGNWRWRLKDGQLNSAVADRLAGLTELFNRSISGQKG